jgi:hypothetical protein
MPTSALKKKKPQQVRLDLYPIKEVVVESKNDESEFRQDITNNLNCGVALLSQQSFEEYTGNSRRQNSPFLYQNTKLDEMFPNYHNLSQKTIDF